MLKYITIFSLAFAFSLFLTPWVRRLATQWGALDLPNERKIHRWPIPQLGGISLFITFHSILLLCSQFEFFCFPPHFLREIRYVYLLGASAIVFALGTVDDFRNVTPRIKLVCQIIAGLLVSLTPFRIEALSAPFGTLDLGLAAIPLTVLWVVAITNALNLLDGLDGLAAGTGFIISLAILGIALLNENIGSALLAVILAGATMGFLKYNFHPASIFLGNSGAYFLGFILSVLSIQSHSKNTTTVIILIPFLLLGLPIMDTLLSLLRRFLKSLNLIKNGNGHEVQWHWGGAGGLFRADCDHIHHRLLRLGFSQRRAVILLYAISCVLGFLAFSAVYFSNINHALVVLALGISAYIGVKKLDYSEIQVLRNGTLLPLFNAPLLGQRILKTSLDVGCIALAYYFAFWLRFEGQMDAGVKQYFLTTIPFVLPVKMLVFYFAGLYQGPWRYHNVSDLMKVGKAVTLACAMMALIFWVRAPEGAVSWTVFVIDFHLLFFMILALRSSYRILEYFYEMNLDRGKKALIYGIGEDSLHALKEILHNPRLNLRPVGFIDDDPQNHGRKVEGYPVLGSLEALEGIVNQDHIAEIIIAQQDLSPEQLSRLAHLCNTHRISLRRFQSQF